MVVISFNLNDIFPQVQAVTGTRGLESLKFSQSPSASESDGLKSFSRNWDVNI